MIRVALLYNIYLIYILPSLSSLCKSVQYVIFEGKTAMCKHTDEPAQREIQVVWDFN